MKSNNIFLASLGCIDVVQSLRHIQLSGTPWTVACQAPLVCGVFPGSHSGVDCHFFLQGIFPVQGSNLHLLHWQADSLALSHQGSPSPSPNQPQIITLVLFSDSIQDLATYHSYCPRLAYSIKEEKAC